MRWLSLALAFSLFISVLLPWYSLPLLGWSVPTPAWNSLGLVLMVLAGMHLLRALSVPGTAWAIRFLLPWGCYGWWTSEELFRAWGKSTLAPVQLKVSGLNTALSHLGVEPLSLFDPVLWREMEAGWGAKLAGVSLLLALLITAVDRPLRSRCPHCDATVSPEDPCCHGCGHRFPEVPACGQCGRAPLSGDRFCRGCGSSLAPSP